MIKPIILIGSCARDEKNGYNQACRDTWIKDCEGVVDYKFIMGEGAPQIEDSLVLSCKDDYLSLPYKTRDGHKWALEQGYTHYFQCFTDTYISIPRLLTSGYEDHHYVGHARGDGDYPGPGAYACGGAGYWMDEFATKLIIDREPDHWAEDLWVGRVLGEYGLCINQDRRYTHNMEGGGLILPDNHTITVHLSKGTDVYDPRWMYETHTRSCR